MAEQKTITPLVKLTDDMDRPTIMGRVVKLWTAYNPSTKKKYSYDFVMVDSKVCQLYFYSFTTLLKYVNQVIFSL